MQYGNIEHRFTLRLNKEDNELFEEKFKKSKMNNRNDFIRSLIRYGFVYTIDYSFLQEYNMQLGKIGVNINQIAHKVNSNELIGQEDIKELQGDMKKIWQLQKSMLLKEPLINQ